MKRLMPGMIAALVCFTCTVAHAGPWTYLFDGKSLEGWESLGSPEWRVEDGRLIVEGTGDEMGWLVHETPFENFVLSVRYKWHGGNSGIQFRSHLDGSTMKGYQANLDPGRETATGSLVDENGRGMVKATSKKAGEIFRPGEWNTYEITAVGHDIAISLNGQPALKVNDPEGATDGIIALQMAPGDGAKLEFGEIRVLPLPDDAAWESLFDGKSLAGWQPIGDSTWSVEDGAIHGRYKNLDYGWLISDETYGDFHFATEFKMPSGNSGIQFRSTRVENMVHGYQADLADNTDWITGHLYDQNRDGSLVKPDFDVLSEIDLNEWNKYEITAIGPTVSLFINGKKTVEYTNPDKPLEGIFAFQIHSRHEMDTWWRNVRVIELD